MDRNLHNFLLVAENGSFTQASKQFGISQPALTKSIKKLEDLYQVQLFKRMARGVILTDYGELLLRRTRAAQNELNYAKEEIDRIRFGTYAHLRIGCGPLWAMTIVPEILSQLEKEFDGIKAEVTMDHSSSLLNLLDEHMIDVAVSGTVKSLDNPAIGQMKLKDAASIIVARKDHPVHTLSLNSIDKLDEYKWTNLLRNQFDIVTNRTMIKRIPSDPHVTLTTNSLNFALLHAAKSDNLVIIPDALRELAKIHGLQTVQLSHPFREFSTTLYYVKSSRNLPIVQRFIQLLAKWDADRHTREKQ